MSRFRTTAWSRRSRRTSVVAAGLAAVLVGIAVAYFLTARDFPGNTVAGGTLGVSADGLPLTFESISGEQAFLYPSKEPAADADPRTRSRFDGVTDYFTLRNENSVTAGYKISAECTNCSSSTDAAAQWANLSARIQTGTPPAPGGAPGNPGAGAPDPDVIYYGKLSNLVNVSLATLRSKTYKGLNEASFEVTVWLDDNNDLQPQSITSVWKFVIEAQTPPPAA